MKEKRRSGRRKKEKGKRKEKIRNVGEEKVEGRRGQNREEKAGKT